MEEHTITKTTKVFMVITALFFDLVQFGVSFIPIIGQIISIFINIFAQFTFWFWFKINGVEYNSTKRLASFASGALIGFIPILQMLPELTLEVLLILATLSVEKKIAEKVPGGEKVVSIARQLSSKQPEVKNLKENIKDLKADSVRRSI